MKKKLLAVLLCTAMSFTLLTGCGKAAETAPAATEETKEEAKEEETEEAEEETTDADACDDDVFAALQETYGYLLEEYNMVTDYYNTNDNIPQDDDVEEALNSAKDYLDEVAEIEQTEINNADAVALAQSMQQVGDSLADLAESLDIVAANNAAANEMCSDESFAALQESFSYLADEYNAVNDYYLKNDSIPQSDDVEEALASAKDYLDYIGDVQQEELTEADAEDVAQSMVEVAEALQKIAESF